MPSNQHIRRLSILTFNTWNCQGDYPQRLAAMTDGLIALAPDIVLLQEVFADGTGGQNTAKSLAAALGFHCAFHPARGKVRQLNGTQILCSSGLAVITRYPIVWSERFVLPSDPRDGERIAQFTEIDIGRERLLLVNLHLSHLELADNLRRQQLDSIVDRMTTSWTHDHMVLGGDFNATADRPLFDSLTRHDILVPQRAPSATPIGLGVDHLFAISRRTAPPFEISSATETLHEAGENGVQASDHSGVQAWLTLRAIADDTAGKSTISR